MEQAQPTIVKAVTQPTGVVSLTAVKPGDDKPPGLVVAEWDLGTYHHTLYATAPAPGERRNEHAERAIQKYAGITSVIFGPVTTIITPL